MARITVEDCLNQVDNRFELIHLAAKRVRQLRKGAEPLVVCKNKDIVLSLREIAAGEVVKVDKKDLDIDPAAAEPVLPSASASPEPDAQVEEEEPAEGESEPAKE